MRNIQFISCVCACYSIGSITSVWIGIHRRDMNFEWTNASAPSFSISNGLLLPMLVFAIDSAPVESSKVRFKQIQSTCKYLSS